MPKTRRTRQRAKAKRELRSKQWYAGCDQGEPAPKKKPKPEIPAFYRTKKWYALRHEVLIRDAHRCQYCGCEARTADHITPRARGGLDAVENLVAVCRTCNALAGGLVFVDFDAKKTWILENRVPVPAQRLAEAKRTKAPTTVSRPLTGLRKKLALKHQPAHVRDALTLKVTS